MYNLQRSADLAATVNNTKYYELRVVKWKMPATATNKGAPLLSHSHFTATHITSPLLSLFTTLRYECFICIYAFVFRSAAGSNLLVGMKMSWD